MEDRPWGVQKARVDLLGDESGAPVYIVPLLRIDRSHVPVKLDNIVNKLLTLPAKHWSSPQQCLHGDYLYVNFLSV